MTAASAQVTVQCVFDFPFCRIRLCIKKGFCGHDHSIDAVPALGRLFVDERLLQRTGPVRASQSLKGGYFTTRGALGWYDTGAYRSSVQNDGAGATLSQAASEFRTI
jgi:hypothetical protein